MNRGVESLTVRTEAEFILTEFEREAMPDEWQSGKHGATLKLKIEDLDVDFKKNFLSITEAKPEKRVKIVVFKSQDLEPPSVVAFTEQNLPDGEEITLENENPAYLNAGKISRMAAKHIKWYRSR